MKAYFKIILSAFIAFSAVSCESDDERLVDLTNLAAPTNLGATFQITQDNSGLVTIIPTGQGATLYEIDFGDGSPASENVKVGETIEHIYAEGEYEVVITGENLNGETAQGTQVLTLSFLPPKNLEAVITPDPTNNYRVTVSATAENAAMFQVYFGEAEDEEPVPLMIGESVEHIYNSIGTYTIRVIALSGGAATTEVTQEVVITDPLFLPIDFESETLDYTWAGFGGASGAVIDNPDASGINTSAKVTELVKSNGAETWAGISLNLDEPVDFSEGTIIKMKVWAPESGVPILFKLEDSSSPIVNGSASVFVEVIQNTTTSSEWEELSFDLSTFEAFDPTISYDRVVVFYDFENTGEGATFYFDDITSPVSGQGGSDSPSVAAPAPELPAENVISMFSGAYTNVTVDTWGAAWSNPTLEEVSVAGNATKKYSNLDFVGIEAGSAPIDASGMTHFHTDIWTPNLTEFKIKLVDFGANGIYDGGGDDVEHEIVISNPAQNEWVSLDIPLSEFSGLTTRAHIAQLIYSGSPTGTGTVYIDNVYFHN